MQLNMSNKEDNHNRYLIVIFCIAVIAIIFVFGIYFYIFDGNVSDKQNVWGVFGDYIGGTLNPILSFLALIALLFTIAIQTKQLYLSRKELELTKIELAKTADAAQRQAKHLEKESRRSDIYRIIEKLSTRINTNYNENRIDPPPAASNPLSIHSALKKGDDISTNKQLRWMNDNYQSEGTNTYQTIKWVENDLERLSRYITLYEEATESKETSTPFPEFYREEFGFMVSVFYKLNMVNKDIYQFYCEK